MLAWLHFANADVTSQAQRLRACCLFVKVVEESVSFVDARQLYQLGVSAGNSRFFSFLMYAEQFAFCVFYNNVKG